MDDVWKKVKSSVTCRECGKSGHLEYCVWESSCGGYEDYKYRCNSCGEFWWVDGPDA